MVPKINIPIQAEICIRHYGRYLVNRTRLLDHYYKTKCEISGEDASWKNSTWSNLNGCLYAIIHFHIAVIW